MTKGRRDGFRHGGVVFYICLTFNDISVRAMNRITDCTVIPFIAFFNRFPLRFRSLESYSFNE